MEIIIKEVKFRLDFSFILVVSFALLYGYESALWLVLFSVLHELGHLSALILFKAKVNEICLSFFGFGINYKGRLSSVQEAIMLLCGPLVNLILYVVIGNEVNLLLFLLNIIPVFPLDGGRLLLIIFSEKAKLISLAILFVLVAFSVFLFVKFKVFTLPLIAAYLLIFNLRSL